ncbi:uncharacterized protein M6B38_364285 [Iris pallida]|uniref:Membrane lipoprotein n=1 Tax=Iris pallida TaxID=29817 RepID=A0AAX6GHG1_IRIPA|nr:uncharacterized protein M6B38_364285 [Iris pallida]
MVVMKSLGGAGIVISLVSAFLVLALLAELYYLLWWKQHHRTTVPTAKRRRRRRRKVVVLEEDDDEEESNTTTTTTTTSPAKELLHLFCWKKPTALTPQHINNVSAAAAAATSEDYSCPNNSSGIEAADFARLRSLSAGLPRFLFTIKEETKEDLESENGSGKSSRGRSMSADDMVLVETTAGTETPYLTPLSSPAFFTPPLTPVDKRGAINPLFESFKSDTGLSRMKSSSSSPPPKFKFMRDAEEKLYRKILTEEAMRVHRSSSSSTSPACSAASATTAIGTDDREDGSRFITIVVGKNRDEGQQQNQTSSTATHGKLISYFGANQ